MTQREEKKVLVAGLIEIPSPSGSPSIRLRFWIACEAAPFQRLSIEAKAMTRPEASFWARWIRQRFVSRTPLTPGGSERHLDEGLVSVALLVEGEQPRRVDGLRGADVAAHQLALVVRHQVWDEGDGGRPRSHCSPASSPSSCAISGVWRWAVTLYGRVSSVSLTTSISSAAALPAPETPDLASITTSSISPSAASGASASRLAVG